MIPPPVVPLDNESEVLIADVALIILPAVAPLTAAPPAVPELKLDLISSTSAVASMRG